MTEVSHATLDELAAIQPPQPDLDRTITANPANVTRADTLAARPDPGTAAFAKSLVGARLPPETVAEAFSRRRN